MPYPTLFTGFPFQGYPTASCDPVTETICHEQTVDCGGTWKIAEVGTGGGTDGLNYGEGNISTDGSFTVDSTAYCAGYPAFMVVSATCNDGTTIVLDSFVSSGYDDDGQCIANDYYRSFVSVCCPRSEMVCETITYTPDPTTASISSLLALFGVGKGSNKIPNLQYADGTFVKNAIGPLFTNKNFGFDTAFGQGKGLNILDELAAKIIDPQTGKTALDDILDLRLDGTNISARINKRKLIDYIVGSNAVKNINSEIMKKSLEDWLIEGDTSGYRPGVVGRGGSVWKPPVNFDDWWDALTGTRNDLPQGNDRLIKNTRDICKRGIPDARDIVNQSRISKKKLIQFVKNGAKAGKKIGGFIGIVCMLLEAKSFAEDPEAFINEVIDNVLWVNKMGDADIPTGCDPLLLETCEPDRNSEDNSGNIIIGSHGRKYIEKDGQLIRYPMAPKLPKKNDGDIELWKDRRAIDLFNRTYRRSMPSRMIQQTYNSNNTSSELLMTLNNGAVSIAPPIIARPRSEFR